ncbi:endonuclease III [Bittarella massiliensis]|uniref:endonuclease III n=1 Tax=Bittarella massiliensis (ex Durand et al. 2017) TaxID=1720313 RepID=UPI00163BB2B8|nr:endonuclease III [Bittarella massiliensis (ex Durand et al. 2017)]MBC2871610.1 endonuclease III [Bittarella massiliensis (ex Durand et al. 2017)]
MTKKERALEAVRRLKEIYPMSDCTLEYDQPYRLLIAVRLAAQCTDARVNQITPILFERFPTLESLADADPKDVEAIVRPCGLGKTKARDIVSLCGMLIDQYDSQVPDSLEELLKLPGVGRKTANLIVGDVFGKPAIVTDTHCIRLSYRIGLTERKEPVKVEMALRKIIPPEESNNFCHRLVYFGRDVCNARSPKCEGCPLADICKKTDVEKKPAKKPATKKAAAPAV